MATFVDELMLKLPSELRSKAATLCIYGHDANQMLLVSRDDEVYALTGFNSDTGMTQSMAFCFNATTSASVNAANCFVSRIDVLCGKGVCELAHSTSQTNNRYVLLRTREGELFSFGDPAQIDDSMSPNGTLPSASKRRSSCLFAHQSCTLVSAHPFLQDKKIVQIACGMNHAACLTSYGEVFVWSIVAQSGLMSKLPTLSRTGSPATAHKVKHHGDEANGNYSGASAVPTSTSKLTLFGCIARRRSPFVEIASYQDVVVGLDEDGRIYEWPFSEHHLNATYNKVIELTSDEGMLNCRLLTNDAIRDSRIVHIASGRSHCLAVSNAFAVYTWGSNDCGQLGLGQPSSSVSSPNSPCVGSRESTQPANSHFVVTPTRVSYFDEAPITPMKKIKAVAAHPHLDISIAEAVTGDIFVWGDLAVSGFTACTSRPTWTRCRSVSEALQCYGRLPYTPSTAFVPVPYPTLARCLLEAFDNPDHSDMQIVVPGFAPIFAHKQFLDLRSPRFLSVFGAKGWHQGRAILIAIDNIPYTVVRSFLRFLYTNEFLGIDKQIELDCDDLISLCEMAESCGESLLRKLVCDHIISNCLAVENAAAIYASALRRPNLEREASLPSACLSFILANLVEVVRSESFVALDGAVAKRILVEAASTHKAAAKKP